MLFCEKVSSMRKGVAYFHLVQTKLKLEIKTQNGECALACRPRKINIFIKIISIKIE